MTPQELKNSILQLAIQGKLVEQRPEEGTAEELYQQIQAEKQRLTKAGTIKNDKPLPEITEDEKSFDIPVGWKWCRLGELCTLIRGITFPGTEKSREPLKGCIRCATTGSVQSSYNETADVFVPAKYIKNTMQWLENEDIMLSTANSKELVGKSCLWFGNNKMTFGGFLTVARFPNLLFRKYLYYVIQYLHKSGIFAQESTQTTNIANINNDILSKMSISLPPLAEQKRIVAKIEELLPYIDRYEQAWSKLEDFNKRFPTDMQKSILQIAIQGKLVNQHPEEGTGEELYQQIQAEKQRLIKDGIIKKEKPLPEITEDEKPFDIPESWKWVRLGDCSSYSQTKEKVNASSITEDMWSLDLEDIEKESGRIINYCFASERKIVGDKVKFYKGQILYSKLRPYLKKILVAPNSGICSSEMVPFVAYGNIDPQYLVYVLKSPHVDFTINSVTYGVKMPRVGTDTMDNLLVPLPPLAEQKRIVERLEEILPLCEKLKR